MKKIVAFILTVTLLLCASIPALAAKYDLNEAKKSVVRIVVEYTVNDERSKVNGETFYSAGSGFAVGKLDDSAVEYIVTAGHVVHRDIDSGTTSVPTVYSPLKDGSEGYVEVKVNKIMVLLDDIHNYQSAQYVDCLPNADVALIKLNTAFIGRRPAVLTDRTEFEINEPLTTMGFPSVTEHNLSPEAMGEMISDISHVSVNQGTFVMLDTHATTHRGDQITTNALMDHGISGGPLLDNNGYVVGVCTGGSIENPNANYAVTTGEVLKLLGTVNGLKYERGPLKAEGLSTTMIIIIAAGAAVIIALILVIILSSRGKKNARTMVFGGVLGGKAVALKKGVSIVVGRDPNRCQVVYPKDTNGVSSVHCTVTFDGTQVLVADNGSSYGTFVGGQKVEPGKPVVMHRGQEAYFGSNKNTAELH